MISLKPDFFKEEIRCGFTVCEEMKRAWAAEMEVLSEVIAVCKKYGLEYRIPNNLDYKRYIDADKKIEGYAIREVFLKRIGECSVVSLDLNTLRELLP